MEAMTNEHEAKTHSDPSPDPVETDPIETDPGPEPSAVPERGEALVEVEGLFKHYGPIKAVDGITLSVRRGDILGFMGPNGAGKTTAMRIITGFLAPDSGSVKVCGHDMATDSLEARQRIGYLPENAPAYGEMTVTGFLEFIAEARGVTDIAGAVKRVIGLAELRKVQHQTIETLSKGFKRRVGLAQALIHDPEVLILDEPTDGLDPNQKAVVQDLIASLSKEKCIILSTHILDEVERVCNRAMIINQGKILVDSTPKDLIRRAPGHNVMRVTVKGDPSELATKIQNADWCDFIEVADHVITAHPKGGESRLSELLELAQGTTLESIEQQEGRLDDIFRQTTQGVSR